MKMQVVSLRGAIELTGALYTPNIVAGLSIFTMKSLRLIVEQVVA